MASRRTIALQWALAVFAFMFALVGHLGCGDAGARKALTPEALADAKRLFGERCARCHGALGRGDGPDAIKVGPRPRNFSDPTWQLAVSDRHLEDVIVRGGAAVGKSSVMPAHPDLAGRAELLAALRQHLRVLAASP
jgi:mono/diheme cytochrome c family protein